MSGKWRPDGQDERVPLLGDTAWNNPLPDNGRVEKCGFCDRYFPRKDLRRQEGVLVCPDDYDEPRRRGK